MKVDNFVDELSIYENFLLIVFGRIAFDLVYQQNRFRSFKMNVQRIQLNLSPRFNKSNRDILKQKMSFSTEKNRKKSISNTSKNIKCPSVRLNDFELVLLAAGV